MRTEKYYVYVGPGHIEYFNELDKAWECATFYGSIVKENEFSNINRR